MAIVRWEPVRELTTLQSEMNRLFNTFFDTPTAGDGAPARRWVPAMDLVEHEDHFVLTADLPGVTQDDVSIEVQDNVLTISGERRTSRESSGTGYYRLERSTGAFSRTLTLPEGVDAEAVQASFANGVLEVRVPKPEQRKPRRVSISLGDAPATIEGEAAGAPAEAGGAEAETADHAA
jgi:HSP20 family protein